MPGGSFLFSTAEDFQRLDNPPCAFLFVDPPPDFKGFAVSGQKAELPVRGTERGRRVEYNAVEVFRLQFPLCIGFTVGGLQCEADDNLVGTFSGTDRPGDIRRWFQTQRQLLIRLRHLF
jgi:hypothetical protein